MRRLAKCRRCNELYRARLDGRDTGKCPLCIELEYAETVEREHIRARRRDLFLGIAAGLMLAGGLAGFLLTREPQTVIARSGGPTLEIRSDPVAVDVFLDDLWAGTTSLDGRMMLELPRGGAGAHWLEFRRAGYQSQRRLLAMADLARPIAVLLARAPVEASVDSDPPGAAVWIAGEPRGSTPLKLSLPVDSLTTIPVRVVKDGYEPFQRQLSLPPAGEPLSLVARLEAAPPRIRIESQPPGAAVSLDDRDLGATPLVASLDKSLRGRRIRVHGRLAGYNPVASDVEIPSDPTQTPRVTLVLDTPAAALRIDTDPPGGVLWLGGRRIGAAPQRVELSAEQAGRPIKLEAGLGGTHFGTREIAAPAPGREEAVTVAMSFVGRKVVFAAELTATSDVAAVRERMKDEIARLEPRQNFRIVAATDAQRVVRSWDGWLPASSENKVRAYDFIDQLRPGGASPMPDSLPREVASAQADAAWCFVNQSPAESAWKRWCNPGGATLCVVAGRDVIGSGWFGSFVEQRRGTLEPLASEVAATPQSDDLDDAHE